MQTLLDRLKRERRWALLFFVVAAAAMILVQHFVVAPAVEEPHRPQPASEFSG